MGAIVSAAQLERVLGLHRVCARRRARGCCMAATARSTPHLRGGFFVEPTVFCDVTPSMRIAREEIFGPVLAILPWSDEAAMLRAGQRRRLRPHVLDLDQRPDDRACARRARGGGLRVDQRGRAAISSARRSAASSSPGFGREECFGELLAFTQEKNIHVRLARRAG